MLSKFSKSDKSGDEQITSESDAIVIGYYNFDGGSKQLLVRKSSVDMWKVASMDNISTSPNERFTIIDIGYF